jgi:hypothetical protein
MVSASSVHTDCGHEVELAGAWPALNDGAPSILERHDEDFLAALLGELATDAATTLVAKHRPTSGADSFLRLYQPVHRTFNVALLEAHCTGFGLPRLDARQIDSAGLVVRRVRTDRNGAKYYDAWCATKHRITGWVQLPPVDDPDHRRDPDPARRPQPRLTADPAFDREKFGGGDPTAEETTSLFVAPPDTAAATKRTLLYGIIPVTSASRAGAAPKGQEPDAKNWSDHLSVLLRQTDAREIWPKGSSALTADDLNSTAILNSNDTINTNQTRFVLAVRQLAQEFMLLRPHNPETRNALVRTLNQLTVTLTDESTRPLGDYLVLAARVYFEKPEPTLGVLRPHLWPALEAAFAASLATQLRQLANEIALATFRTDQAGGRFDDPTAVYAIRAFIRVKQPCDCPPKIVWSPYSAEFRIVPWYESGPTGPVPVTLPDPFDPNFLNNAKPNVAFNVPASLANLLNQDPKNFLGGTPTRGSGLTLDWICGFSIPIITICAFILLNIMLNLLNIIFRWLPFVKICIPFPRPK